MASAGGRVDVPDALKGSTVFDSNTGAPISGDTIQVPFINVTGDSDWYDGSDRSQSKVLIFNQEKFDQRRYREAGASISDRTGTNVDRDALVETFKALGFAETNINVFQDAKYETIEQAIKRASENVNSNADCFVCCVLTHGFENGFLCAQDRQYCDENLYRPFEGKLVGKPKLFFIQACCGSNLDEGTPVVTLQSDGDEDEDEDGYEPHTIPNTADFLIHRSTVPGYYSWRNKGDGSWFIQALTSVLKKAATSANPDDLLSLCTVVNRKVAYEFASICNDPRFHGKKQQPSVYHTLTRKFKITSNAPN